MSFYGGDVSGTRSLVLYRDPIVTGRDVGLSGVDGLGEFGIAPAIILAAVPGIVDSIRKLFGAAKPMTDADRIMAVWKAVPADAIGTHVGADGWWYDNIDGHQLGYDEADKRKSQVVAATIGSYVGADGWWYDNADNHRLTPAEAWQRHVQLAQLAPTPSGQTWQPSTSTTYRPPVTGQPGTTAPLQASVFGNISPTMLVIGAAVLVGVLAFTRPQHGRAS